MEKECEENVTDTLSISIQKFGKKNYLSEASFKPFTV